VLRDDTHGGRVSVLNNVTVLILDNILYIYIHIRICFSFNRFLHVLATILALRFRVRKHGSRNVRVNGIVRRVAHTFHTNKNTYYQILRTVFTSDLQIDKMTILICIHLTNAVETIRSSLVSC